MEETRFVEKAGVITAWYPKAAEATQRVPVHFAFNPDEMGCQKGTDRTGTAYMIPASHGNDHIYILVSRRGKRITLWPVSVSMVLH
jgi:hypothetical protein